MPGLIRRSDIDEVRSRTEIVDVIGEQVALKRAGVGSMKGLCPFHDERTPSFTVRSGVGRYHCFGCGEDGDVFTFLQRTEHLSFSESVERLAGRIGYQLTYEDGERAADTSNRARLLKANAAAAEYFQDQLGRDEAQPGRDFLVDRGFDQQAALDFGVGYAPRGYESLSRHLLANGFTKDEILAAGLVGSGERGLYDRFRGRLVWPIRDVTGQPVGFGARKLYDDDNGPKYLNTPETPVFHKSQVLYGLDKARREVSKQRRVVVVEGYTDVMACHLAGITTAVATCGTSFGVDHIKLMRRVMGDFEVADQRGSGQVVFTFDPDEAGQKAASRAFAEEQRFASQTFVAVPPEGLDPADLWLHKGAAAVQQMIDGRKPLFEFMLRRVLAGHDLDTVEGRVQALRATAPIVAGIRDRAMHDGYARELAGWLGEDLEAVRQAVATARGRVIATSDSPGRIAIEAVTAAAAMPPEDEGQGDRWKRDGDRKPWQDRGGDRKPWQDRDGGPRQQQLPPRVVVPDEQGRYAPDDRDAPPTDEELAGVPDPVQPRHRATPPDEQAPARVGASIAELPSDVNTRVERDALQAILQHPEFFGEDLLRAASRAAFASGLLAVVRDGLAVAIEGGPPANGAVWLDRVAHEVPPHYAGLVRELGVLTAPVRDEQGLERWATDIVVSLVDRDLLRQKVELLGRLRRAEGDADGQRAIQHELVALEEQRRSLRGD
jgi:DNA primase